MKDIVKKASLFAICSLLVVATPLGALGPQTSSAGKDEAQQPGAHAGHQMPGSKKPQEVKPAEPKKPGEPEQKMEEMQHTGHEAAKPPQEQKAQPPAEGEQEMPGMQHMGRIPVVKPEYPRMGKAQEQASGPLIRLADLEQMALANNPTLKQAAAEVRAAAGRQLQSGLYPNPRVGYTGEEIRGGFARGGQQGFFVEQTFVTGGKLKLNRRILGQEVRISEIEAEEQRLRVMNGVRLAYYRVLAAQEMLETKKDLLHISGETLKTARRLRNIGQADDTEVLQAEVEEQQLEMAVMMRENTLRQAWRALAAVVGNPDLPLSTLEGNLEKDLPGLEEQQVLDALLQESPAVKIAQTSVTRAEEVLARARREPIPDIQVRAGLQRNGALLEGIMRPVGLQGFAEVGVQLYIFNRNQGNVQAARAEIERAKEEQRRVNLLLRERATTVFQMYRNSRIMADRYRTQLLPRAQTTYEKTLQKYGLMTASYPQVLLTQRTLFQMQTDYIAALEGLWANAITLQGFLLTEGLEAPTRPGDVDRPVREINVPLPTAMMEGR